MDRWWPLLEEQGRKALRKDQGVEGPPASMWSLWLVFTFVGQSVGLSWWGEAGKTKD